MIAEKSISQAAYPNATVQSDVPLQNRGSAGAPARPSDQDRALHDLAAQIRADASHDPVFYLVRSNTSYDGE